MIKLALAIAAAALAFVVTPASAGHRGSHGHHSSHGHSHHSHHGHAHRSHHVHSHHSNYRHHTYAHAYKPVHYGYSHRHTYSAPTYVQPHVTAYAPTNCFWQVQKHGYEHRKVWVCPQAQYKTVEHVKPEVKVVEVAPAPEVPQ